LNAEGNREGRYYDGILYSNVNKFSKSGFDRECDPTMTKADTVVAFRSDDTA